MKKFLLTFGSLALLAVFAILAWSNYESRQTIGELRSEIAQQEQARRDLQRQVSSAQRGPKPEQQAGDRQRIEQQTSELRGLSFKSPVQYKMIYRTE